MISVAMATYNGEKYLQKQLDSILRQSVQNIEIIICDDCSTDKTWEILQKNANEDPRVHCYQNEQNLGFKKNFEKAISLCKGEFVALSDQDDIWESSHLELLLQNIQGYDIACGDAVLIDGSDKEIGTTLSEADFLYDIPTAPLDFAYRIFYNNSCFQGASMLVRSGFLQKALPIPQDVLYHDTWFAALASFSNGIIYTKDIVTRHRIHGTNVSHRPHWRSLFHLLRFKRNRQRKDRIPLAEAIRQRSSILSQDQEQFLIHTVQYRDNRSSQLGRLKNFLFRLKHYHAIYTTNRKIFIEW